MNVLRSLLFIPGDSEKKLGNGDRAGADALVLDLEDSVLPDNKARARGLAAEYLRGRPPGARPSELWVRINALDSTLALSDLSAVVAAVPDGVMLPKAEGPADVARLSFYLDALEAQAGLAVGSIRVLPVATETAAAPFNLGAYSAARLSRLVGLTWGSEDLSTALGASTNRDASGEWAFTYRVVRSLTLMGAHAAGVQAIDTLYADFRDEKGLRTASQASRAEGFHRAPRDSSGAGTGDQRELHALRRRNRTRAPCGSGLRCIPRRRRGGPRRKNGRCPAPQAGTGADTAGGSIPALTGAAIPEPGLLNPGPRRARSDSSS